MADMAGREDLNISNAQVTRKRVSTKAQETSVEGDTVVSPGFDYTKNQKIAQPKPIKCGGANKCTLPAVVGIDSDLGDRQHLCQLHWEKQKAVNPSVGQNYFPIYNDPQEAARLRAESAAERQEGRVRDADTILKVTGQYSPVRGPGRPVTGEKVDRREERPTRVALGDARTQGATSSLLQGGSAQHDDLEALADSLLKSLDHSSVYGGRNVTSDHEDNLSIAHTALLHALTASNGGANTTALSERYHSTAHALGMTNPQDRDKYFAHAMALESRRRKSAVTPKPDLVNRAVEDVQRNYAGATDKFNEVSELMDSDTPTIANSGKKSLGERPE